MVTHHRDQQLYSNQLLKIQVSNRIQCWIQLLESWIIGYIRKGKLINKAKYVILWLLVSVIGKMKLKENMGCILILDKAQISGSQRLATSFQGSHIGKSSGGITA